MQLLNSFKYQFEVSMLFADYTNSLKMSHTSQNMIVDSVSDFIHHWELSEIVI